MEGGRLLNYKEGGGTFEVELSRREGNQAFRCRRGSNKMTPEKRKRGGASHQSLHGFADGSSHCQGARSFPALFVCLWLLSGQEFGGRPSTAHTCFVL